jgi:tetratricopeptide (TPR) repeat protein
MNDSTYWEWHHRGLEAWNAARLSEAAEAFARARAEALRRRLPFVDRAYCNWAAIRHVQDRTTGLEKGLSRILGGSQDPRARQLAAYHLACICCSQKNLKRARFYGKMAVRLAESLGVISGRIASVHLLGLAWLAESRLKEACACFKEALDLSAGQEEQSHTVMTKSTLGYCLSLQGRQREGLSLLEEALVDLADLDCRAYEPSLRLNLGFALLEGGDLEGAIAQGRAALQLLEEQGSKGDAKFAYYLLGEGHAQRGAGRQAEEYFEILQKRYYPQYPGLAQMLLACRTSPMLNWLAQ